VAYNTFSDSVRSVTFQVSIDPDTQEIVIAVSGQATRAGVRGLTWGITGIPLKSGRLVVPGAEGSYFDAGNFPGKLTLAYPTFWQAQLLIFEGALGGFHVYSTDRNALFKKLVLAAGQGGATVTTSFMTDALAPFPAASDVPAVEWRLGCFQGDWRVPAAAYRDRFNRLWPPVAASGKRAWISGIRTVVTFATLDTAALDALTARVVPSKTLLYLQNWRRDGYDINYPDYTPNPNAKAFVDRARRAGFRIMLHTDLVGVAPGNPDYAAVRDWQVKDPESLALRGGYWDHPESDPYRFAFINPAASAYRRLFIARVRTAIDALQPDAIHLDVSGVVMEDGNGMIEGMNFGQGSAVLHQELEAAFPDVIFGGETVNEVVAPYEWLAQRWSARQQTGIEIAAHPINTFLLGSRFLLYGYLGQPSPQDPGYLAYFQQYERQGVVPTPVVYSTLNLDTSQRDTARLFDLVKTWQSHDLVPDWDGDWKGALFQYRGSDGSVARLDDGVNIIRLTVNGQAIYQRVHGTNSVQTDASIPDWPAFDTKSVLGLDPSQQYWLDPTQKRLSATHISAIQPGVMLDSRTLVTADSVYLDVASAVPPALDFAKDLWQAAQGVTYDGIDGPVADGAALAITSFSAGGETRRVLLAHPPYLGTQRGGETFIEYTVSVPDATGVTLKFAGIDDAASRTEPITFRVAVNGAELWRQDVPKGPWQAGVVDLSAYRGQTTAIRFITNPGPNFNTAFAAAGWSAISIENDPVNSTVEVSAPGQSRVATIPIALPGTALRFLTTPRMLAAGGSLFDLPFTAWLQPYDRLAAPGSIYGSGTVGPAPSGGVTKTRALNAHPPVNGRTILTWTVTLPASAASLAFSTGIADGANANSTGLVFLIRINGTQVWTIQASQPGWKSDLIDLTPWKRQPVLVELVTDSLGDNTYDWAVWADLVITP
jgi:hypothetical protein